MSILKRSDKMQFTIYGYSQSKLVELNLDIVDVLILRYFVNFKNSGTMLKEKFKDEIYYWLNYKNIAEDLPILSMKKDSIYRRLKNMTELNILQHITIKNKGIYSYYKLGPEYLSLISKLSYKNSKDFNQDIYPNFGQESICLKEQNLYPSEDASITPKDTSPEQKTPLLDDSYTKDSNTKENIYRCVIDYLNEKAGTNYKYTTKKTQQLIKAREKENFTLEDFYKVIDNKTQQWLNTDMEQYLRPETLFGAKFESYLNQNNRRKTEYAKNTENSGEIRECEVGFTV